MCAQTLVNALASRDLNILFPLDETAEAPTPPYAPHFNGAVGTRPLAVVECSDESAVRAALRIAADHTVPVSVMAGGHDISARALAPKNLVLDIRGMSGVRVDPIESLVAVEGGALTRDLLSGVPEDLVTVTGTVGSLGVVGAALAGGYGRLNSRYGLVSDCIERARVVAADGSVVTASADEDAELLWALRGGGSGFGVVTSMSLRLHRLPQVLSATILYPLDDAVDMLLRTQALLDEHPVELSIFVAFMTTREGERMMQLAPMWSGERRQGEAIVETLVGCHGSSVLNQGWSSYRDTFDEQAEKAWPKGRNYHLLTRTIRRLDETAAEMLASGARSMTSPNSAIVLHDFHGTPTQIAREATAFQLREDHYVVEIIGAWDSRPDDDGAPHRDWADRLSGELAQIAIPGGYVNLLGPDEMERARQFYGGASGRLIDIKRRLDPHDRFRCAVGRLVA